MILAMCVVIGILIVTMVYLSFSGYKFTMKLGYVLCTIYSIFFVISMIIGILSREE